MTQQFYLVDVFAEQPFSGNPLAVVVGEEPLSAEIMQKIATEMNFSETTFAISVPDDNGGYRVRIFTPSQEIAFAGHPILGTAHIIRNCILPEPTSKVLLNIAVGQVPVTYEKSAKEKQVAWFQAPQMTLGATTTCGPMAAALGISQEDIETSTPIQMISARTSALIVPIRSLEALSRCNLNLNKFATLAREGFSPLVYLFCQQTHTPQNDLCVRFFFEAHGVREDPATGNGAAFLGAYLMKHQLFPGTSLSIRIEQGHEVRRPSLIMLRARMLDEGCEVSVGGHVITTVQGQLL